MNTPDPPKRIQLRRTKGWRKPEDSVTVSRPTWWGNPWRVGMPHPSHGWPMSRGETVALFRDAIEHNALHFTVAQIRKHLRGKDLACWCPLDQPCHADVLLEIANAS